MALIDLRSTEPSDHRDPVAVIGSCLDTLAAETRGGWSAPGVTGRVRDLAEVHRRAEIELVRVVAQWDAGGLCGDDGYFSAQSWLVREVGWRNLHVSRTFDGNVAIDGLLDPETGALFLAALDALDEPDPLDGDTPARSYAQRRADCLAEMARRSLASDGHLDPDKTINVVIDADLITGEPCTDTCDPDCTGHAPAPRAAGDLIDKRSTINGQPVNPKLIHQHLCDSWISRIIMGPDGVILDLGRRQRASPSPHPKAGSSGGCAGGRRP